MKKLISVLVLALTLLSVFSFAGCGAKTQTAMIVNGVEIPQGVMNYYINAGKDYLTSYGINLEDETGAMYMSMLEEQGVDIVTEIAVVKSLAAEKGITLAEGVLSDAVAQEKENFGTTTTWNTWLEGYGMTEADVEWILEYQLLADALFENLNEDLTLSDEEVAAIYNENPEKYDTFKFGNIVLAPEGEETTDPETGETTTAEPTEADWENTKATVQGFIDRINSGEAKFEDLAARYNQDSTKSTGGDLGQYITKDNSPYVSEFNDAAFTLTEIGEITQEPIKSSFGYHIIKLLDKTEGAEDARDTIIDEQLGEERNARYTEAISEAMENVTVTQDYVRQYTYTEPADDTDNNDADAADDTDSNDDNAADDANTAQ